jgi:TRAP-type C4-dicarboxylate transport system permease small subunit
MPDSKVLFQTEERLMPEKSSIPPQKTSITQWCRRNPVELLGCFLCILLTGVVFFQVLFRYALHAPLAWSEEFAMFLFQWCSFIGAAIAVRHRFHYALDLITKRLSARWKLAMQILASVAIFIFAYLMIHMGIGMMGITLAQTYPVLGISVAYAYLAIVISGALMILYQIPFFTRQIQNLFQR